MIVPACLLGATLGLVWSPCSGPLLASALALVATEGGALRGGVILAFFGAGAAIPLVAVAYASRAGIQRVRGCVLANAVRLKPGFAIVIAVTGIATLTGADKWFEARVTAMPPTHG